MVIVLCIESPNACMIGMRCNQSNIFEASLNQSFGEVSHANKDCDKLLILFGFGTETILFAAFFCIKRKYFLRFSYQ